MTPTIRRDLQVLWLDFQILLSDVLIAILERLQESIEYRQVELAEAERRVEFVEMAVTEGGVMVFSGGVRHEVGDAEFSVN